jgi:hypothetical protein
MYTPRIHWVARGTGTPKNRDEVKREGMKNVFVVYLRQNKKPRVKKVTLKQ